MTKPEWPKRPDGSPKTMGELTKDEQQAQFDYTIERLKPEFKAMGVVLESKKNLN